MCHQQVPRPLHEALKLSLSPSTASPRFSLGAPARPLCVWQAVFCRLPFHSVFAVRLLAEALAECPGPCIALGKLLPSSSNF